MRSVHFLGLGFVVGFTALGIAVAAMLFRWNEIAYPERPAAGVAQPAPGKPGAAMPAEAAQGQTIFQQRCRSCHTIGGGRSVGPDLQTVAQQRPRDFLIQMITDPDAALATPTGQQLLAEYGTRMPNLGVNQQQAEQLLAYIDFQSGAAPAKPGAPQATVAPTPQATPPAKAPAAAGDPARGRASFDQKCASCHTIGGGRMVGPDLQNATTRRSHDYLVNMITQPDRMTASDPTAQQLLKEYGVQMPNLGIQPAEAEDIIAHIAQQSGGALGPSGVPPAADGHAVHSEHAMTMAVAAEAAPSGRQAAAPAAPAAQQPAGPAAAPPPQQPAGNPEQGRAVWDQKCAGCHSIGGGRRAGPDLKGVTDQRPRDYLVRAITEPDRLIATGDPTATQLAREYGMPMPNVGVNQQQAQDVLAYIQQQSGGQAPPAGAPPAPAIEPGNSANGRALFAGERRLSAGGPACIACHDVAGIGAFRGGTWGLDLTKQQSKMGTEGIVGVLKSPAFPGMKEAYANRPIGDEEAADLAAFFIEADRQEPATSPEIAFPLVGLLAFFVMIGVAGIAWLGRTKPVRKSLVGGAGR